MWSTTSGAEHQNIKVSISFYSWECKKKAVSACVLYLLQKTKCMQKKSQWRVFIESFQARFLRKWINTVTQIPNIKSFLSMVDNRPSIYRFILTVNTVPEKDSEPTGCNPIQRGKEFLPDPCHWFVCSLKNKCDYLFISALASVTINVNSTHNLVLILGVSYCTRFDYG